MIWIAGPCVIESFELCESVLTYCLSLAKRYGLKYYFKASFDKANRTSINAFRGPGLKEGLRILQALKDAYAVNIITDVHEVSQVEAVADVVDVIQIPAFLCRQTDLLVAAGRTGKIVNIKKGQFMDPRNMKYVLEKVGTHQNRSNIWLTERGTSFGYDRLIVDFWSLYTMKQFGVPVILDVTHSVQCPGGGVEKTGGLVDYVSVLGAAGIAAGASGVFTEVHPNPEKALSDAATSLSFEKISRCLYQWMSLWKRSQPYQEVRPNTV